MTEDLRKLIREYLCDTPMSPDPASPYQKLGDKVVAQCAVEGIPVQAGTRSWLNAPLRASPYKPPSTRLQRNGAASGAKTLDAHTLPRYRVSCRWGMTIRP
jgi:hypothetical protein